MDILPAEIWCKILDPLPIPNHGKLAQLNKQCNALFTADEIWRIFAEQVLMHSVPAHGLKAYVEKYGIRKIKDSQELESAIIGFLSRIRLGVNRCFSYISVPKSPDLDWMTIKMKGSIDPFSPGDIPISNLLYKFPLDFEVSSVGEIPLDELEKISLVVPEKCGFISNIIYMKKGAKAAITMSIGVEQPPNHYNFYAYAELHNGAVKCATAIRAQMVRTVMRLEDEYQNSAFPLLLKERPHEICTFAFQD